jgi:YHS domain-containing protein
MAVVAGRLHSLARGMICRLERIAGPMRKNFALLLTLSLSLAMALNVVAAEEAAKGKLTRVESKTVCMINEQVMGSDQIPVEVEDKTYYGCCAMCVNALTNDASKRVAIDPFSGNEVDKATAVIAANADGNIFYFESEETLAKYNEQAAQ